MPRYLLDTDTCSYIMKRSYPTVPKRRRGVPVADVCMSVIRNTLPLRVWKERLAQGARQLHPKPRSGMRIVKGHAEDERPRQADDAEVLVDL